MVLLHVLCQLRRAHGWKLEIAHFNHQLRGEASESDERFVRATAEKLSLPFHADKGDVAGLARSKGISIEMAGRELRQVFFARVAVGQKLFHVALAHHADDQVETFWLRLLRGEVGSGLTGMRWKRQAADDPQVTLVRPLLNIFKKELAEYAREQGIEFREDRSNTDLHYQRNRIRHEILPGLEKYQTQLRAITLRTVEVLASDKDFLGQAALDWRRTGKPGFEALHTALQREVIRLQLVEMSVAPTFELIEDLRSCEEKFFTVSEGREIFRTSGGLIREKKGSSVRFDKAEASLALICPGAAQFGDKVVRWQSVKSRGEREDSVEYFDRDALGEGIVIRHWRPGDRFQPIGAEHSSKLQDLFTNLKVPVAGRHERLVGVAQNSEIFWVEGMRIGEKFKVTPKTKEILRWSWQHSPAKSTQEFGPFL
jgi:tRNA(Ile)-lysidine synthase